MTLPADYTLLSWQEKINVRNEYKIRQGNKCLFCKEDLDTNAPEAITEKKIRWELFPENFLKYPVHLQHNHETNMTEGAVHNYCNAVMWQYYNR